MKNNRFKYLITTLLSFIILTQSIFAGEPPDLVAQSAILMDRATGSIIYQKNANIQMYPASTTKILTSILCIENLDTEDSVTKTSDSVQSVPSDSSHIGLKIGDTFSILDGINAVMLGSDNYVSHDLASLLDGSIEAFADRMNRKAKELGANNSNFINPHGYHDPNHYTTAHDLALIMDYAFSNSTFRTIVKSPDYTLNRLNDTAHPIEFSNTVKLVNPESPYYRPYNLGGKTGFTKAAGRSLVATASKDGMDLVGVVLKSESPDFFEDMNALFDYGFENFALKTKDNNPYLQNNSFSPWAKEPIDFALEHNLLKNTPQNYQTPISKKDFVDLLIRTIYIAQNDNVEGYSKEYGISHALKWGLIPNTSLLSGFNNPISKETGAQLITHLLSSIDYKPIWVYPLNTYEDQDENLTLEEGIAAATGLYKLYSHSIHSYLNKF